MSNGGGGGGSNRPSSAGTNRSSSSDPKKRAIWTTNGIQLQQTEKKETPIPQSPPGYARPKSASMGRSKSQGRYGQDESNSSDTQQTQTNHPYLINQKDRPIPTPVLGQQQQQHYQQQQQQQYPSRPNIDQYANSNDRWTSSYRLQYGGNINNGTNTPNSTSGSYSNPSTSRPYSGSSPNPTHQYYQRNGGKEVILDENISFQGINLSNTHDNSYDSGEISNNNNNNNNFNRNNNINGNMNGNTASSRIRAAINLGNQYNQQVKQKNQVVEDVVAIAKERETNTISEQQQQQQSQQQSQQQQRPSSSNSGYAEARPRMIKTIHNTTTTTPSTIQNQNITPVKINSTEADDNDGIDIDDNENNDGADEDDDIMGEGRDMEGIGTEEGGYIHKHIDSRSYGHTTNPEVSTPSLSIELGQQSSLSAHLHPNHNSIDIRNGSSSLEEIPSEYSFKLSTLPNQFCSLKEAVDLQKIILSCRGDKPTSNGPAAAALMDMYMVGKIVGVGSYGKVRAAWHRLTSSKVAIKTYDKSKLKDPEHW
eukprot:CAMPEP_0174818114 /NCGR_PEP_ID=MMETSP1107-20130205/734_1 /TAXON_ID=36770 /ORGANISM="Paraphysomonas vestita, Strain GFlagA" /LENGTH=535 /DNA_ID=CAMNT_0016029533 /DNA_START=319 /DNA_END=1923 /DNA_ORIENTATION=-